MSQDIKKESKQTVEEFHGERSKKVLKCCTEATAHMKEHFRMVKDRASQGEPVLWNWGAPLMMLESMDIFYLQVVYWSALCSAKQMSRYYLDVLNVEGYFRDLCRYCTVALGYAFDHKPEIGPWGGLPKFTTMVGARNDDPSQKLWELYAREFEVPLYMIDRFDWSRLPREMWWEDLREGDEDAETFRVDFYLDELKELTRFLETITGKHLHISQLRRMLERHNQQCEYWWRGTDLACDTIPCPIGWADVLSNVPALLYFPGTEWGVNHAKKYYEEIKEKVERKEGVAPNEKVRLMWEGHPVWFSPGFYNAFEERYGAVFLPMYYAYQQQMGIRRNLSNPLRTLASQLAQFPLWRLPTTRIHWELYKAKEYQVNGAIFMLVESCKLLYTGVLFSRQAFEKAGIPTMEINADMVDARDWDDTKMKSLVASFIETLAL